ncbi:MAG: universal stress protein [Candidatus Hadarchaeota archaeon]
MNKKILVPVDGSRCSEKAFQYSLDEADQLNNRLTILRVVSDFGYSGELLEKGLKKQIGEARKYVKELKKGADERGIETKIDVITGTDTATEIVKFADKGEYDLIVIGSRGRTELETITLGSVSEGVVKRANCPVLVVR